MGQFIAEYLLRLWSCGYISRFHGARTGIAELRLIFRSLRLNNPSIRGRLRYAIHPLRLLDLSILTLSAFGLFTFNKMHLALCLVRAINVLRLLSMDRTLSSLRFLIIREFMCL